jgi:hypothetical protein
MASWILRNLTVEPYLPRGHERMPDTSELRSEVAPAEKGTGPATGLVNAEIEPVDLAGVNSHDER